MGKADRVEVETLAYTDSLKDCEYATWDDVFMAIGTRKNNNELRDLMREAISEELTNGALDFIWSDIWPDRPPLADILVDSVREAKARYMLRVVKDYPEFENLDTSKLEAQV